LDLGPRMVRAASPEPITNPSSRGLKAKTALSANGSFLIDAEPMLNPGRGSIYVWRGRPEGRAGPFDCSACQRRRQSLRRPKAVRVERLPFDGEALGS